LVGGNISPERVSEPASKFWPAIEKKCKKRFIPGTYILWACGKLWGFATQILDIEEGGMRRNALFVVAFLLAASLSITAVKGAEKQKTFVGSISDSMCGLKHMMPGGDKACTSVITSKPAIREQVKTGQRRPSGSKLLPPGRR
jgi:hypothetical protein